MANPSGASYGSSWPTAKSCLDAYCRSSTPPNRRIIRSSKESFGLADLVELRDEGFYPRAKSSCGMETRETDHTMLKRRIGPTVVMSFLHLQPALRSHQAPTE